MPIEDYEANGTWENGKFRPWGEMKPEDGVKMPLDETFSSAGFEHKERQVDVGMVNRVKLAGRIAFRVATCPFRRKP